MSRRVAAAAALILVGLAPAACRNARVVTATYATLDEARQAGAIDRGWIPALVPAGAHDLREAHDPGTSRRWGLFDFRQADDAALRAAIGQEPISLDGRTCDIARRIEWWPVMLRGRLRDEQLRATGLVAYAAPGGGLVVAVNWNQRRAYYWTNPN